MKSIKQKIKQKLIDFIAASEGNPLREKLITTLYMERAIKKGVDPIHISLAKQIARTNGMNECLGYISLIVRLNRGEVLVIPQLLQSYPSEDLHAILLRDYNIVEAKLIEAEVAANGNSYLMQKTIEDGDVCLEDPTFQNYITNRIDKALNQRKKTVVNAVNNFNNDKALPVLTEIMQIFSAAKKTPFLSSGTLLGAVRDKAFIKGDTNINLGLFAKDMTAVEVESLFANPLFERIVIEADRVSLRHKRSHILIEISLYTENQKLVSCGTSVHRWWHRPFTVKPSVFLGLDVYIPENPEQYLTERYGNWESPMLYFDAEYDGPNHTFTNSLDSIIYLSERTSKDFRKGNRYFADQGAYALRDYFNIDYTQYIPQPHHKSAIPFPITDKDIEENEIVLAFGAFDHFNLSQISEIQNAKKKGTYLVLGIFSDALMACLSSKPMKMSEIDRVNMARALVGVDNVCLLETHEAIEGIIEHLHPKTIIGDYNIPLVPLHTRPGRNTQEQVIAS